MPHYLGCGCVTIRTMLAGGESSKLVPGAAVDLFECGLLLAIVVVVGLLANVVTTGGADDTMTQFTWRLLSNWK